MGRSPGKWIKSVLFGKKSSKSHTLKAKDGLKSMNDKGHVDKNSPSIPAAGSPVISQPVLVNTNRDGAFSELEHRTPSGLTAAAVTSATSQNVVNQVIVESDVSRDSVKIREEQAAIKVQAAFRGFLSRRAFHVLKGIIRLQAVVRGHLVRRQAVATLYSLHGIVRLQAIIRGRKVRLSNVGFESKTKYWQAKDVEDDQLVKWKEKYSYSPFISKLLSASDVVKPLRIHYDQGEPNSVFLWMDYWTSSRFWRPLPEVKKAVSSKSRPRRVSGNRDSEPGKVKRNVHKTNIERGPANNTTEPERLKRNLRKVPTSHVDAMQENPQNELEKVKRSLRKVSSSTTEPFEKPDVENEKLFSSLSKMTTTSTGISDLGIDKLSEKLKNDVAVTPDNDNDLEAPPKQLSPEKSNSATNIDTAAKLTSEVVEKEEDLSVLNEVIPKEEQGCEESHRSSKRRASFGENGLPNPSKLPSYMAATESAKAKLRGQVSPKFGSDPAEKGSVTRRHSLPSSMNGKLSSQSPRTQKLIQAGCKGVLRNDRSLSSSRDGNDKPIQVAWRR